MKIHTKAELQACVNTLPEIQPHLDAHPRTGTGCGNASSAAGG